MMENVTIDILVFVLIILLSFAVTVYKNLSNSKEKTKNEYVLANESASSTWPMLMSIARGFLGVRVFLGEFLNFFITRRCRLKIPSIDIFSVKKL